MRLKAVHCRRRPQLLVVAYQDELLHAARETCEEMRLKDLGGCRWGVGGRVSNTWGPYAVAWRPPLRKTHPPPRRQSQAAAVL